MFLAEFSIARGSHTRISSYTRKISQLSVTKKERKQLAAAALYTELTQNTVLSFLFFIYLHFLNKCLVRKTK